MSEPLDRNKTDLTHACTATAAAWMESIGCKPVEKEVTVSGGWIADLAGVWEPTMTELRRTKAIHRWVFDEDDPRDHSRYTRITRSIGHRMLVCVEVKTSRGDFTKDCGRKYAGSRGPASMLAPAHICVLAATGNILKGIVDDPGWKNAWGVLKLSASGERVVSAKDAMPFMPNALHPYQIDAFNAGLITALDHRTRYARIREWRKSINAEQAERARRLREIGSEEGL